MNRPPSRLSERDDAMGRLLRDANAAYRAQSDEDAAWRRLRERLPVEPAESGFVRWSWLVLPAFAAAAGVALYLRANASETPSIGLVAEPEPTLPTATADSPALAPVQPSPSAEAQPGPAWVPRAIDCRRPLATTAPRDAAYCLEQRANGASLDAERALFELAMLRKDRLHDLPGALAALRTHRKRFPSGALRGEVDFALVELLPEVGRVEEALAESAALLEKPWGRSRASELKLSRGTLYQDRLNDCESALQDLAPIRTEYGPTGDEAEFRFARCLEELGDLAQAERSYASYLARQSPRHAEAARARSAALTAARTPSP